MLTELKFQLQLTPGKSKFPNVPGVVPGDIFSSRKQTSLLAQPVSKALLPWSTDGNSMSTQIVLPANGYRNTDELTVIIVCARARVHVYINTLSSSVLWHIGVKKKKKNHLHFSLLLLPKFWGIRGTRQSEKSHCLWPMHHPWQNSLHASWCT